MPSPSRAPTSLPFALALALALPAVTPTRAHAQREGATPSAPAATETEAQRESSSQLEALLAQLRTSNNAARHTASEELARAIEPADVPAARARLLSSLGVSHLNVHASMVRAIRAVTGGRENADYDLLEVLLNATPRSPEIDVATERVALARAVGRVQTADAGRAVVAFALAHNAIFRMETTRIIRNTTRDYVVPALIEMRRPNENERMFIRGVRQDIRRVTPGDTVQTRDNALLAEILRSYGALKQPEAMNVVASFVNSDRSQVRDAAREAVNQYGAMAANVLRQAYENAVGERANPNWSWERVARELYQASDRRRGDEVRQALEDGLAAARTRDYARMMERFEFVLARHPLSERRPEMVEPIAAYARSLENSNATRSDELYRMALRLDPTHRSANQLQGAVLFLEAERALAAGVADPELYRAVLRVDPQNERAQSQLATITQTEVLRARRTKKRIAASGIFLLALSTLGTMLTRRSRKSDKGPSPARPGPQPAPHESTSATDTTPGASATDTEPGGLARFALGEGATASASIA